MPGMEKVREKVREKVNDFLTDKCDPTGKIHQNALGDIMQFNPARGLFLEKAAAYHKETKIKNIHELDPAHIDLIGREFKLGGRTTLLKEFRDMIGELGKKLDGVEGVENPDALAENIFVELGNLKKELGQDKLDTHLGNILRKLLEQKE